MIDQKTGKALRTYLRDAGQLLDVRDRDGVDVFLYLVEEEDVAEFPELAGVVHIEVWQHGLELKHADGTCTEIDLQQTPSEPGL